MTKVKIGRDYRISATIHRFEIIGEVTSGLDSLKLKLSGGASGGQHVRYILSISCTSAQWILQKRFSDFATLHEVLRASHPFVPELPAKTLRRNLGQEHLEKRKQLLNVFLGELCKTRALLNDVHLHEFFNLRAHIAEFKQPSPQIPVQVARMQEACFGIVDLDYDPVGGLLLIGATDTLWASCMNTKITNIKYPWGAASPNLPSSQMTLWRLSSTQSHFETIFCCNSVERIGCVLLSDIDNNCLCGLSDGSVGFHAIQADSQVSFNNLPRLPLLKHTAPVIALALDKERQWLISVSKDRAVFIYEPTRHTVLCTAQTLAVPTAVHYCSEAKRLFIGLVSGRFAVWNTSALPIREFSMIPACEGTQITAINYHHATGTVFVASKEGLMLWTLKYSASGRMMGKVPGMASVPTALVWLNSSREVLLGFCNGTVCVFDVDKGDASYVLSAHDNDVTKLVWLDDSRRLLSASTDKSLKIWDFPSQQTEQLDRGAISSLPSRSTEPRQPSPNESDSCTGALVSHMHPLASTCGSGHFNQAGVSNTTLVSPVVVNTISTKFDPAVAGDSHNDLAGWDK